MAKPKREDYPAGLKGNRLYQLALERYNNPSNRTNASQTIRQGLAIKPNPTAAQTRGRGKPEATPAAKPEIKEGETRLLGGQILLTRKDGKWVRLPYGPGGSATGSGQGQAQQNPLNPEQRANIKPKPAPAASTTSKPKPKPKPAAPAAAKPKPKPPANTTRSATVMRSPTGKEYAGPAFGERKAESKVGPIADGQKYSVQKTGKSVMQQQADELQKMGTKSESFKAEVEKARKESMAKSLKIKQEAEKKRRKGPRG